MKEEQAGNRVADREIEDIRAFCQDLDAETDRGAAIVGAAYLDESLRQLIASFLVDDSKEVKEVLGIEKPLGSFASRIRVSYCMGLIGRHEYHDPKIIKKI